MRLPDGIFPMPETNDDYEGLPVDSPFREICPNCPIVEREEATQECLKHLRLERKLIDLLLGMY